MKHVFATACLVVGCAMSAGSLAQSVFDCVAPTPPAIDPLVLGNGTAGSVTTTQLQQALDNGGAIRLNIGTSTFTVGATLTATEPTVLDLATAQRLSGGDARRVIEVQNPHNLTYTFVLEHGAVVHGSTPNDSGAGLYKATGGPWQAVTDPAVRHALCR